MTELNDFIQKSSNEIEVNTKMSGNTPRKIRKIKRPRIRPTNDVSNIPPKLLPDDLDAPRNNIPTDIKEKSVITEPDVSLEPTQAEGIIAFDNIENAEINQVEEETSHNTDLVNIKDIQNSSLQNNSDNDYGIEALPPDLEYMTEDEEDSDSYVDASNYVKKSLVYVLAGLCFFIGFFIGKTLFATQTIEKHGLEGVVVNPDVPAGRPRCGRTDKSQACVFYVMNWYKQELNGRDFYKLAAQLTGREEYMIETDNLLYANVKIKPGHIAQLNIPSLK